MRKDLKVSHDLFNLIVNFVKLCKVASYLPLMTDILQYTLLPKMRNNVNSNETQRF